jgi:hypothetical protein
MKRTCSITLTILAAASALAVSGCDDTKTRARREAACATNPQSEDCLSAGRSHSSIAYLFFGQQPYGHPSYYGSPAWTAMQARSGGISSFGSVSESSVARGGFGEAAAGHSGGGE